MIKCKQVMGDKTPECGKEICCYECEQREGCGNSCNEYESNPEAASECEERFNDENALVVMQKQEAAIIQAIADLTVQKKKIEDQEKEMRAKLVQAMERYGVKSLETPEVKFVYIAPTTRTTIDSAKLKKDLPDVAAKYSKTSNVSASVKITVK